MAKSLTIIVIIALMIGMVGAKHGIAKSIMRQQCLRVTVVEVTKWLMKTEKEEAIAKARDQEAKLWFETWYSHYISPTKPLQGEFARFATERIQMTGYERDQALPTEDNK